MQVSAAAQSLSSTQLIVQALLPSQANGVQSVSCGTHCMPPLQAYVVSVEAAQVDGKHIVPGA